MLDPYDLTVPWDARRLQEWFLFGVCVAGKPASATAAKLDRFLYDGLRNPKPLPFDIINTLIAARLLGRRLRKYKMGQYDRIEKAFRGMVQINPATVSIEGLESIHGVAAKTSRMLLLYTRPGLDVIPLDTHILKWLRANGYDAPKNTPPPGKKYRELELAFLAEGKKRGLDAKAWDTKVWQMYASQTKVSTRNRQNQIIP